MFSLKPLSSAAPQLSPNPPMSALRKAYGQTAFSNSVFNVLSSMNWFSSYLPEQFYSVPGETKSLHLECGALVLMGWGVHLLRVR